MAESSKEVSSFYTNLGLSNLDEVSIVCDIPLLVWLPHFRLALLFLKKLNVFLQPFVGFFPQLKHVLFSLF
jgi:hypothetical protein